MKRLFLCLTLSCLSIAASSQIDKEFWFVAPDLAFGHGDRPIYMRISTMEDTANIMLRMPANLSFSPIYQEINPNTTFSIDLTPWIDIIENAPADAVLNRGLLLTSDNLVTAYYECAHTNNPGIFALKGKNGIGTEFYIVSQNDYRNQVGQESFDIVATEDNTNVTITPSDAITGHPAGVPYEITLNKGQTYTARATNTTAERTLNGSLIVSDKPIAVSWQDDSLYQGGSYDVICDQIIPTNILGVEYIAIKGYANANEHIYVCGTQPNTDIYINGGTSPVATIQAGDLYKYAIPTSDNTVYLQSTEPVHVLHLTGFNNEFGGSVLPQDSCTGSYQIGFNRTNANDFALLILTRSGNEGSFLVNGSNAVIMASDFSVVPGTSNDWVYARKQLTTAQVPVGPNLISNSAGKFHLGILHKTGASAEYGYFSDFSSLYLGADASMCPGDSMILDAGANMTTYEWFRLVSGTWNLIGSTRYFTVTDSGSYSCVVNGNFCTLMDTINISYYPNATVDLGNDTTVCQNQTITLNPGNFVSYYWSTGYTGPILTTSQGGEIWVRVENNNDCIATDTMILYIDSLPQVHQAIIGPDTVCQEQTGVYYYIDSLHFTTSYFWTFPPGASGTSDTADITLDFSTGAASGPLTVYGHNHCGNGPDTTLFITVKNLPGPAGMINGPDTVCQTEAGIQFTTHTIDYATAYQWSFPPGIALISGAGNDTVIVAVGPAAASGDISVYGSNDCGTGDTTLFSLTVKPFPVPAGPISGSDTVCQGSVSVSYSVPPITGASSYLWTLPPGCSLISGAGNSSILADFDSTAQSGTITVKGWSDCGTGDSSSFAVTVQHLPEPAGAISGPDTLCQGATGAAFSLLPLAFASSYLWTVPPGVTITAGAGTNQITVSLSRSAVSGTITVQGHNDTCGAGRHSSFALHINPLPADAGPITGPDTVCQNQPDVIYSVSPIAYAQDYLWTYTGTGATLTNQGASATLDFSTEATAGILTVKGVNDCGDGLLSQGFPIFIHPCPLVSLTLFPDITTRDAQPIRLRGGIPKGGTFSGTGVSSGWFFPDQIPVGSDTIILTYTYNNMYGCINYATARIQVKPAPLFSCGDTLTDVRDSARYPTVQIGTQCWMAANLHFGNRISSAQGQRDNYIPELYCYNDAPAPCDLNSALYQWEEVMQYDDTPAGQGLCPPGWHLPTETEWILLFNQFINNGFAGNALKETGYSGFDAWCSGIGFHSRVWKYPSSDPTLRSVVYWSSTSHGPRKAWAHGMNQVAADIEFTPSVSFYPAYRSNGFAVRCVMD